MANERLPERSIPDRSPGHAFIAIAHAGCCRRTKLSKAGVVVWYSELARRILPRPSPTPAGDKPPRYIFSLRHRSSVYKSAGFAGGEPALRLIGGHIPDRSPGHAFVPMKKWRGERRIRRWDCLLRPRIYGNLWINCTRIQAIWRFEEARLTAGVAEN